MKKYNKPEIYVLCLQSADIITLSNREMGLNPEDILSLELGSH
jgi:hypothetical protein